MPPRSSVPHQPERTEDSFVNVQKKGPRSSPVWVFAKVMFLVAVGCFAMIGFLVTLFALVLIFAEPSSGGNIFR